jgi:minor extracellular serine protease Vpr
MWNVYRRLFVCSIVISISLLINQSVLANVNLYSPIKPITVNITKALSQGENRFIVELDMPCLAKTFEPLFAFSFIKEYQESMIVSSQQKIVRAIKQINIPYKSLYSYKYLLNGFCLQVDPMYLSTISEIPGIKRIYGINQYYLDRAYSVPAIHAPEVWEMKDSNGKLLTGKGTIVGIIDTGVDYSHQDLGGGIGAKPDGTYYKVISGYDFSEMNPISFDPAYSFHGTHVAGIVAGVGEAGIALGKPVSKGVAPDASLISYKVFTNKEKSTGSDSILYALEQAYKDHCDVVNLSLGRDYGWTEDPLALACDRASDAGIIVVASAGNAGKKDKNYNLYPIHTPGTGLKTISIASSDETIKTGFSYTFQNRTLQIIGRILTNSPQTPKDRKLELVLLKGTGTKEDFGKINTKGKVVLMKRGDLTLQEKNNNAKDAGAEAIIIYNYTNGLFSGILEKKEGNISTLTIDKQNGEAIIALLENESLFIQFQDFEKMSLMSSFSSEGPTPDFYLKPDLTAPGSNILSSVPNGGYDYASGTSMSAPHVSGAAAILKQLHPNFSPADIKSLLVNYSDILKDPSIDKIYSLFQQGAGRLNLLTSVLGNITADPVSISLHNVEKLPCASEISFTFTLKNCSQKVQSINLTAEVMESKNVQIEFEENQLVIKPTESVQIKGKLVLLVDHFLSEGDNQFIISINGPDNPSMHLAGIFYYGKPSNLDPILNCFCFPTLAISPNGDGNADSNELNFLTPYLTDGIEIDLFSDNEKEHLGVLNYYRGINGAGYFSTIFDGSIFGKSLSDGFYSAIPYILPQNKDFTDSSSWLKGKSLKMLIDRVRPEMTLSVKIDPLKEFIKVSGSITDNNSDLGIFCFYEIDSDIVDLITVDSDGTFKASIPMDETYMIIKITAQDLAGNTFSIKKRL